MSTGGKTNITCGCGHTFEGWLWQSANVTASPELRQQVLDGEMNVVKCPSCERRFHVEVPFLYHDIETREWIWVYPREYEQKTGDIHARVQEMWEEVKGKVPPGVRHVFENEYRVIVLFGMDALVLYLRGRRGQVEPDGCGSGS
jgi:hypothetical protein